MTQEEIQEIIDGVQEAIKVAPNLVADMQALFASGAPTDADFDALRAKVSAEDYATFVPASQIPPGQ
jgi:hypothetical protein